MKVMQLILALLCTSLVSSQSPFLRWGRSFTVDNRTFFKDGKPFRFVSGGMHYFRVPHEYWRDRLRKLRAMGANAVETYIEWSLHEPEPEQFDFAGDADVLKFIQLAQEEDLLVILRPGPYICAERNMGGLPYWLLRLNPSMRLRSSDRQYMYWVNKWMTRMLTMLRPLLYSNGGPIILLQIENEYGSYPDHDPLYMKQLKHIFDRTLGADSPLFFTTDGNWDAYVEKGQVAGAVTTVDFGSSDDPVSEVQRSFDVQRRHDSAAPYVNSEYYTGWLDHWAEPHSTQESPRVANTLNAILSVNANVNLYMFHGGTSFGFSNGANYAGNEPNVTYQPDPTSYDYDAPCNEAGDLTGKYFSLKNVILSYLPNPNITIPVPVSPKLVLPKITLTRDLGSIFDLINSYGSQRVFWTYPLTFEEMHQPNGFLSYTHLVSRDLPKISRLQVNGLHDRAIVCVNDVKVGVLSRMAHRYQMDIALKRSDMLQILVEDQGRIGFNRLNNELKGILGTVRLNDEEIKEWHNQQVPFHRRDFVEYLESLPGTAVGSNSDTESPRVWRGRFILPQEPLDTFVRLPGWTKGNIWINGFNLGRYWPPVGPQITLYLPGVRLRPPPQVNTLLVFELESAPCDQMDNCFVQFTDRHEINAQPHADPAGTYRFVG